MADTTVVVGGAVGTRSPAPTPAPAPAPRTFSQSAGVHLLPGMPVAQSTQEEETAIFAQISSLPSAAVIGLVTAEAAQGGRVQIQPDGTLTLTAEQWSTIGGGAQGLVPGMVYYLSEERPGLLAPIRPRRGGAFATKVGVALSARTMLVQIGEPTQITP